MKLSIVMSTYNRNNILKMVLAGLSKQIFPRDEMEIIVVDDNSTEDILSLLKIYKQTFDFNIKYIKIDQSKSDIPVWGHTPALSNNVGFRNAEGKVVLIQGNDIVHINPYNLQIGYDNALAGWSVFGDVWECSKEFRDKLYHENFEQNDLNCLLNLEGAKDKHYPSEGWYWYVLFIKRDIINQIGGVDEEYLRGVYAEDDNFARRIEIAGAKHIRIPEITALHIWHFDETYDKQQRWGSKRWEEGAKINRARWAEFQKNPTMIANEGREWGSEKVIVQKESIRKYYM